MLRQQFAMQLIQLLYGGKRIINVDQTWLGMSDFRRMKWRQQNTTNSVPSTSMNPRITMFVGLESTGEVYVSLLQSNSNNRVMDIFLRQLVLKLDGQSADWRQNTVILFDNASYHTSESTLRLMEGLQIPVLYTGPYSYDAAPVELLFAAFKSEDVNPNHLPQSKR